MQSRQRTQLSELGSVSGWMPKSQYLFPQSLQELHSEGLTFRKIAEKRLNKPKMAPSGQSSRHQGRCTKKTANRNKTVMIILRVLGKMMSWPAAACLAMLGKAASRAPAGQTARRRRPAPSAVRRRRAARAAAPAGPAHRSADPPRWPPRVSSRFPRGCIQRPSRWPCVVASLHRPRRAGQRSGEFRRGSCAHPRPPLPCMQSPRRCDR